MTNPATIPYRSELDGLRAIAVLAVLGYHAGYNDFAGGFVGVDVFLVLSGYLITQQITVAQSAGQFQPGLFWLRRARRLLPAIVPVLILSALSALILKGDGAFREFAGHFLSAGFFFSNYQFLAEADYFARASDTNLLLHTWSLSLEWQFYLVTPLLLMALGQKGTRVQLLALFLAAILSFALAETLIRTDRGSWAFFGVLPRYWEFALGGCIALVPRLPGPGALYRLLGLTLILFPVVSYSGGLFPGLGAAMPVLGTCFLLIAPDQRIDPFRWLLSTRIVTWIGLRSYAIYLVHWPLFVSVTPANMGNSEGPLSVALVASIILGHLIFRYIELPIRNGARFKPIPAMLRYGGGVLAGVLAIWAIMFSPVAHALRTSLPLAPVRTALTEIDSARTAYFVLQEQLNSGGVATARICSFDDIATRDAMLDCLTSGPEPEILLIGDSHGRDTLAALTLAYPEQPFAMLHQSSCVPASYVRGASICFPDLEAILDTLAEQEALPPVILSARWLAGEHVHTARVITQLATLETPLLIIGPGPTFSEPLETVAIEVGLDGAALADLPGLGSDRLAFNAAAVSDELQGWASDEGAGYIDRFGFFCPDEYCEISRDGDLLYFDEQHLSLPGLTLYAAFLNEAPALQRLISVR